MKILTGKAAVSYVYKRELGGASQKIESDVRKIIDMVQKHGDVALNILADKFGDAPPARFDLNSRRMKKLADSVAKSDRRVIEKAASNIRRFAVKAAAGVKGFEIKSRGFTASLAYSPVRSAACYVPGGKYPLPSTALMTALTAKAAGVPEIAVASPSLAPEIIFAARISGARTFYRIGGAQAIAALALGTETVERVDVIAGPGNAYVAEAKRQLAGKVGIDMIAGPSEIAIIADSGADARKVAVDILAQLEHDQNAAAWVFTDSMKISKEISKQADAVAKELELPVFVTASLRKSAILVFCDLAAACAAADEIAPEHLQLAIGNPKKYAGMLSNYGTLFCGYDSAVPFGDYMAGPNHTLPTGRTARFAGALTPLVFLRPQNRLVVCDASALAGNTAAFAKMEGLKAHAESANLRKFPAIRA